MCTYMYVAMGMRMLVPIHMCMKARRGLGVMVS